MAYRGPQGGQKVQKVMVQPINLIFRYLQNRSRVQIWLYENINMRLEGFIIGFDEYMNIVLDEADEYYVKTKSKKPLGRILLKGDNITLIQSLQNHFQWTMRLQYLLVVLTHFILSADFLEEENIAKLFETSEHTNNWAVLVCTSRFWFNYRHVANVLSLYHSVKRLGVPDSQIILMLADDMPCNARNPRPATVFNNAERHINLYGEDVEVDYRGYEVNVENFIRVLTGRVQTATPRSKRLLSDHKSNVLIYLTGHGGNGFLKFQDAEEITNVDLADAIEYMWEKNRYHEMLLIVDTCQAASMYEKLYSPNVLAAGSSLVGEDSLSHHVDNSIGVFIIDRYTYFILDFLQRVHPDSNRTLQEFLDACPKYKCLSTVGVRYDLYPKVPKRVRATDFLGSVRNIEFLIDSDIDISGPTEDKETKENVDSETKSMKGTSLYYYTNSLPWEPL